LDSPCEVVAGPARNYATVWVGGGKTYVYAHRKAYEEAHGPIPEGYDVHHVCGVKRCVNSEHLEAIPHAEHGFKRRRECDHDPSELRVYVSARQTYRRCLACKREYLKAWRHRRAVVV